MTTENKPKRASKRWTLGEDADLLCMGHLTAKEAGEKLGRTNKAINLRRFILRKEVEKFAEESRAAYIAPPSVDSMLEDFHLYEQPPKGVWQHIKAFFARVMPSA